MEGDETDGWVLFGKFLYQLFHLLITCMCCSNHNAKAYFVAWIFDLLIPLTLSMIMVLIYSKDARRILFPPVPLALVNMATGGVQKPQAGQLGTGNTLTGAPEKREYEAVEEEASNFAKNVRHLVGRAIGMHQKQQNQGGSFEDKIPGPIKNAAKAVKEAGSGPGHASSNDDQTEQPMEEILWDFVNPENIEAVMKAVPHVVGEVVDVWERASKYVSLVCDENEPPSLC